MWQNLGSNRYGMPTRVESWCYYRFWGLQTLEKRRYQTHETFCQKQSETTNPPNAQQLLDVSTSVPAVRDHDRSWQSNPNTILGAVPAHGITNGMAKNKYSSKTPLDHMETGFNRGTTSRTEPKTGKPIRNLEFPTGHAWLVLPLRDKFPLGSDCPSMDKIWRNPTTNQTTSIPWTGTNWPTPTSNRTRKGNDNKARREKDINWKLLVQHTGTRNRSMPKTLTRCVGTTMGIRGRVDWITANTVEYTLTGKGHCS